MYCWVSVYSFFHIKVRYNSRKFWPTISERQTSNLFFVVNEI